MKPPAGTAPVATRALLAQRLDLVYRWYEGMVNSKTGMFEYLYVPDTDAFIRRKRRFATSVQSGMPRSSAIFSAAIRWGR